MKIWQCKIGESVSVPRGADAPMREAVARAYKGLTGEEPTFIFSGWGAELTEPERAVVEARLPVQPAASAEPCRAALAGSTAPVAQEPVAFLCQECDEEGWSTYAVMPNERPPSSDLMHVTPLYTAPVATQPSVPAGWKLVPIQPTEDQWGGLARTIMMAWDFNQKTPYELFDFLSRSGHKIPPWMMQENEMRNRDHIPSKGTRATLIYRAFLEAAPTPPADGQMHSYTYHDHPTHPGYGWIEPIMDADCPLIEARIAEEIAGLLNGRSAPTPPAAKSCLCPKCGVDRSKVPCSGDLMNCPIRGEAQAAVEHPSGWIPCSERVPANDIHVEE